MKLKNSGRALKEKRNSIFYSDISPNQDIVNLEEEEDSKSSPESDENTVIDNQTKSNLATSPKNTNECVGTEEFSADVQLLSDEEPDMPFLVGSLGTQYEIPDNKRVAFVHRPDNLNLLDENGCPVRPPRHIKKKLTDKRDQRLLSVPNIKLQKAELQALRDLRDKEEKNEPNQQPSFTGNLMRRFSKF